MITLAITIFWYVWLLCFIAVGCLFYSNDIQASTNVWTMQTALPWWGVNVSVTRGILQLQLLVSHLEKRVRTAQPLNNVSATQNVRKRNVNARQITLLWGRYLMNSQTNKFSSLFTKFDLFVSNSCLKIVLGFCLIYIKFFKMNKWKYERDIIK